MSNNYNKIHERLTNAHVSNTQGKQVQNGVGTQPLGGQSVSPQNNMYNQQMYQNTQQINPQNNVYNQQMYQNNPQGNVYNQQMYQNTQQINPQNNISPQMQGGNNQIPYDNFQNYPQGGKRGKKKGGKGKFILILVVLLIIGVGVFFVMSKKNNPSQDTNTTDAPVEGSDTQLPVINAGAPAYDALLSALNIYDPIALDDAVGSVNGDSFLAQEWAYVNRVQLREEYLKKIGALVKFSYGEGTLVKVTVPDYSKVYENITDDKDYVLQLYKSSGYSEESYTYEEDLFDLFCQYMVDRMTIPTKEVEIDIPVAMNASGVPVVVNDAELDKVLFSDADFHRICKLFSQICMEFTGKGTETYTVKEEIHNDEYDEWYKLFKEYYDADKGKFSKKSKWEPWYLRDENNNFIYDENGEKIVNYYSIKDENGNDWIQPDETILVDVEKEREIDIEWQEERGIPYAMIGTYYIQNEYSGDYPTVFKVGDGSVGFPAGIGTPIVTKVLCSDNKYHNIKIALKGYWTGQQAIDYAEGFSSKNRGFTTTSPVKLIVFEFTVENLEDNPITFKSEMAIANKNSTTSSRTGTLYGFYDEVTLDGGEKIIMNDWCSSTELDQKYAVWGESFNGNFPLVYFDALAGTGEIPSYSAYKMFAGQPEIEESAPEPVNTEPQYLFTEQEIEERAEEIAEQFGTDN